MVKKTLQKINTSTWFLDLCVSQHLCNNRCLFSNTRAKSIDFIIAAGHVILSKKIAIVSIFLTGGIIIELHNVALAPNCNSNLISLGQLWGSGIIYRNSSNAMMLIRGGQIIAQARRDQNLFTLDLALPAQAISVKTRVMTING